MIRKTALFLAGAAVFVALGVVLLHIVAIGGIYILAWTHSHHSEKADVQTFADLTNDQPRTYTVQQGDDPESIARAFGVSAKDLRRLNHLDDSAKLPAGTVVSLPHSKKSRARFVQL